MFPHRHHSPSHAPHRNSSGVLRWSTAFLFLFSAFFPLVASSASLTENLIGYWTFNGKDTNWTTNQASDLSGQGNTGTLTNMSTSTSPARGKIGQALQFDGTNDYVQVSSTQIIGGDTTFAIALWVKGTGSSWSTYQQNPLYIEEQDSVNTRNYLEIQGSQIGVCSDTPGKVVFDQLPPSGGLMCSNATLALNRWYHLVYTQNGSSRSLYIDGVLDSSDGSAETYTGNAPTATRLGARTALSYYFRGLQDDVRVYNRALSATEVAQLYRQGATKLGVAPVDPLRGGLVGYWTFDGKDTNWTTNQTSDLSGQGNTGTLTNMPTSTSPGIGKIGQALSFDGTDDCVAVGTTNLPTGANTRTTSLWFKLRTNVAQELFGYGQNTLSQRWGMYYESNALYIEGAGVSVNIPWTFNTQWHLFTVALPSGQTNFTGAVLYLDGVNIAHSGTGGSIETLIGSDGATIGALPQASVGGCSLETAGLIDDVRVYNRALSATEVAQLYRQGATKLGVAPVDPLRGGLVGYWTFDGKDMNWTTNQANDVSGQGNHGTIRNMPTSTSPGIGKIGQALSFVDGTNDYIDLGTKSSLSIGGKMTACSWFKSRSVTAGTDIIIINWNGTTNQNYDLEINRAAGKLSAIWGGSVIITGTATLSANTWYHACLTRTGTTGSWTATLYLNGAQDNQASTAINPNGGTTVTWIGDGTATSGFPFNGFIDDVRVYNRALSAAEIQLLYKQGQVKFR